MPPVSTARFHLSKKSALFRCASRFGSWVSMPVTSMVASMATSARFFPSNRAVPVIFPRRPRTVETVMCRTANCAAEWAESMVHSGDWAAAGDGATRAAPKARTKANITCPRRIRSSTWVTGAASAFSMAVRSSAASGVTLLGKNATTWPSLPTTYLLKFHCGRLPICFRNVYTGDWAAPAFVTIFENIGNVTS